MLLKTNNNIKRRVSLSLNVDYVMQEITITVDAFSYITGQSEEDTFNANHFDLALEKFDKLVEKYNKIER